MEHQSGLPQTPQGDSAVTESQTVLLIADHPNLLGTLLHELSQARKMKAHASTDPRGFNVTIRHVPPEGGV
jgi:hypothetical protein